MWHRRRLPGAWSATPCDARLALREEISGDLLAPAIEPWMQEVMGSLHEVELDDVRHIFREPADAPTLPLAIAGANEDTQPHLVVPSLEQDTAVPEADLVLRWGRDQVGDQMHLS